MLAVACPRCGAPCRVCLQTPERLACARCGWTGAPSPGDRARIDAAARIVATSDARARQLRGFPRLLASRSSIYTGVFALVTATCALWTAFAVWATQGRGLDGNRVVLPVAAVLVTLLIALPWFVQTTRRGRRLRALAEALPPLRAGESAACRVCGAPVAGASGVVRCAHCASDNVLDAKVLARAGEQQGNVLRDLESEALSGVSEIGEARTFGLALTASMSLIAVPFVVVTGGAHVEDCMRGRCFDDPPPVIRPVGPDPARVPPPAEAPPPAPVDSSGRTAFGRKLLSLDAGVEPKAVCKDYVAFLFRCGLDGPTGSGRDGISTHLRSKEAEDEMTLQCEQLRSPWAVTAIRCFVETGDAGADSCGAFRACTSARADAP